MNTPNEMMRGDVIFLPLIPFQVCTSSVAESGPCEIEVTHAAASSCVPPLVMLRVVKGKDSL